MTQARARQRARAEPARRVPEPPPRGLRELAVGLFTESEQRSNSEVLRHSLFEQFDEFRLQKCENVRDVEANDLRERGVLIEV